jgi:antagonist of KipI
VGRVRGGRVHFEPWYGSEDPIRIVRGGEWELFDPAWTREDFRVTAQRDRMGLRLGGTALKCRREGERASCPVVPGTIQVPPGGEAIVLLADSQTLGGYPRIAHVVSVDLHRIAQLQTNTKVRFEEVSLETAQDLLRVREAEIARLRVGLAG